MIRTFSYQGVCLIPQGLDGYLTPQEVADHFGVKKDSVLRFIRIERLRATRVNGRSYVIHEEDLPREWPPPLVARVS